MAAALDPVRDKIDRLRHQAAELKSAHAVIKKFGHDLDELAELEAALETLKQHGLLNRSPTDASTNHAEPTSPKTARTKTRVEVIESALRLLGGSAKVNDIIKVMREMDFDLTDDNKEAFKKIHGSMASSRRFRNTGGGIWELVEMSDG